MTVQEIHKAIWEEVAKVDWEDKKAHKYVSVLGTKRRVVDSLRKQGKITSRSWSNLVCHNECVLCLLYHNTDYDEPCEKCPLFRYEGVDCNHDDSPFQGTLSLDKQRFCRCVDRILNIDVLDGDYNKEMKNMLEGEEDEQQIRG